ncbi:hypothetical protein BD413DRAFT_186074 [Trametes elegans]|nr:hypothetical protein BD413DRAFT_186074 [Trametes elegans]
MPTLPHFTRIQRHTPRRSIASIRARLYRDVELSRLDPTHRIVDAVISNRAPPRAAHIRPSASYPRPRRIGSRVCSDPYHLLSHCMPRRIPHPRPAAFPITVPALLKERSSAASPLLPRPRVPRRRPKACASVRARSRRVRPTLGRSKTMQHDGLLQSIIVRPSTITALFARDSKFSLYNNQRWRPRL